MKNEELKIYQGYEGFERIFHSTPLALWRGVGGEAL
jgi:hypothetical protein